MQVHSLDLEGAAPPLWNQAQLGPITHFSTVTQGNITSTIFPTTPPTWGCHTPPLKTETQGVNVTTTGLQILGYSHIPHLRCYRDNIYPFWTPPSTLQLSSPRGCGGDSSITVGQGNKSKDKLPNTLFFSHTHPMNLYSRDKGALDKASAKMLSWPLTCRRSRS